MLIRNAIIDGYLGQVDLRIMHGAVQEIGVGLVKGLYESELDLQGDVLRPGRVIIQPGVTAAELRRLYRQGVALVLTDSMPAGRVGPSSARVQVCSPLPKLVPEEMLKPVRPGTMSPLTRWKKDGAFVSVVDEHSAD